MWRLVLTVSLLCCSSEGSVTCRDENDNPVDWFILYKTPQNLLDNKKLDGLDYVYIYPDNNKKADHGKSTTKINDPEGILAKTLDPLFKFNKNNPQAPSDFGYISYNDGVPVGYSAAVNDPKNTKGGSAPDTFGHSKGVVMVQKNLRGVWLLHSTPKFPSKRDKDNFWPSNGIQNAQTFICVTFNYNQFDKIGRHLQRIKAFPFDAHIPKGFHDELEKAADKNHVKALTNNQFPAELQLLKESRERKFYSIAKHVSAGGNPEDGDLYVSISVDKEVNSDVFVQTWNRKRDKSFCSGNIKVQNIKSVKTGWGEWICGNDHSKWCVADNKPWTCIADVNRAKSQYERPGGALCVEDVEIHRIFKGFLTDERVEKCPDASPPKRPRL